MILPSHDGESWLQSRATAATADQALSKPPIVDQVGLVVEVWSNGFCTRSTCLCHAKAYTDR
ncbi:hypothetical protein PG997_006812 [Apiospora hydei]|uniref:Uncharacterized protein n=1 Tax=Apiospora hydei TaxID=1337664 RepID=A0ABR1WPS4_9PEZI